MMGLLRQYEWCQTARPQNCAEANWLVLLQMHGTGTPLGDPIEIGAATSVYLSANRQESLTLSSSKSSVGHAEPAAGAFCVRNDPASVSMFGGCTVFEGYMLYGIRTLPYTLYLYLYLIHEFVLCIYSMDILSRSKYASALYGLRLTLAGLFVMQGSCLCCGPQLRLRLQRARPCCTSEA